MARFDVYKNPNGAGYLLDVQADLLHDLNTRVVVPLMPRDQAPIPAKRLNPVFNFSGHDYVMATQFLATVPKAILGTPIDDLSQKSEDIMNAIDMVFIGF